MASMRDNAHEMLNQVAAGDYRPAVRTARKGQSMGPRSQREHYADEWIRANGRAHPHVAAWIEDQRKEFEAAREAATRRLYTGCRSGSYLATTCWPRGDGDNQLGKKPAAYNVRFGALCGLKSEVTLSPLSARSRHDGRHRRTPSILCEILYLTDRNAALASGRRTRPLRSQ
jgi:hypothetical protein